MELLSKTPLSSAGRPILLDEEVEVKIEEEVSVLVHNNKKVAYELLPPGVAVLTNLRLVFVASADSLGKSGGNCTVRKVITGWVGFLGSCFCIDYQPAMVF